MKFRVAAALVLVVACAGLVFGVRKYRGSGEGSPIVVPAAPTAKTRGNPQADVRIIEHIDYQCMACRQASLKLKELMVKHPDRIYLEVRFYPIGTHRHGLKSAVWAECAADQGKFWEFHERLFETQIWWGTLEDPRTAFLGFARALGLDMARIETCVTAEDTAARIRSGLAEAQAIGIRSTPTFLINGRMVVGSFELSKALAAYFPDEAADAPKP